MDDEGPQNEPQQEKTQPAISALRYETPSELYTAMPQIRNLMQHRPRDDESAVAFLARLRSSTTPEEAVTFTAFAARAKMAIWWAYECVRTSSEEMSADDRALMEQIANWTTHPDAQNRYMVMKEALWAPQRTPVVLLGLAVGWSGGQFAPNDPSQVPPYRTPRAVNSAVLSCLAKSSLNRRPIELARFLDLALSLYRVL